MSDVGTITEIEPEDQLGWIDLPNGDRVRFGGTACKGFVPEVGMQVRVTGTRPGYGGTVKATGLEKVQDAPRKMAPGSVANASAPAAAPRKGLATVQNAGVRASDLLLGILGRADVDPALHADLEALGFEVQPQPGSGLDCHNPWVYVIAMDGGGNAYALYAHPLFGGHPELPWVFWNHETDTVSFLANDTAGFFQALLASAGQRGGAAAAAAPRARETLGKLGMADQPSHPLAEQPAPWLPPTDDQLRPLDQYLAETDGAEMERGLLAYTSRKRNEQAKQALHSIYQAWSWQLPTW